MDRTIENMLTFRMSDIETPEIEIEENSEPSSYASFNSEIDESPEPEQAGKDKNQQRDTEVDREYELEIQRRWLEIISRGPEKSRGGSTSASVKLENERKDSVEDVHNISINGKVN